ncbi:MAG: hypothetical protein ACPLXP_01200 [Microgenomates group bacterium]
MTLVYRAILKTLAYADVFDYPLTIKELYRFLIIKRPLSFSSFREVLRRIQANEKRIEVKGKYFFLRGRGKIVNIRKKRERWSQKKIKIARRVTKWLRLIPTVKMVAVTGALAMKNSDKNDDIDLLIVTAKNRLWLTRILVVFLVELVARRRRPKDVDVRDKICLNMFLDEKHLAVPKNEQDLFTAHEVVQLKPLWDKDNTYQKFLRANLWVKRFLANNLDIKGKKDKPLNFSISQFLNFLEHLAYKIQVAYMSSRRTREIVEFHRVRFHPQDCREWVIKEYQKRLKNLSLNS